jgi:hypothetical protein
MKALKYWRQPDFVCMRVWNELQGLARAQMDSTDVSLLVYL